MSQIAAALARSKGKKVDPVPPTDSVVPAIHTSTPPMPAPVAAAEPAKRNYSLRDLAGAGAAIVALSVVLFLIFRPSPRPEPPAPAPKAAVAKPTPTPAVAPAPPTAPAAAPAPKVDAPAPEAPPAAAVSAELEQQLKAVVITARRTGADPRIVVGGKVFAPGDEVLPGAFLESVHADRVVFRDAAKNKFERR